MMSQYRKRRAEQPGALVGDARICAECGRLVSTDDRYCSGCGTAFAGAPARAERGPTLPGFQYHLVQGLGWGLGFALAGAIVTLIFWTLVALTMQGLR
jgi:hypothetical protein